MSGKRDSNSRPQPWQGCALPTELFPQMKGAKTSSGMSPNEISFSVCQCFAVQLSCLRLQRYTFFFIQQTFPYSFLWNNPKFLAQQGNLSMLGSLIITGHTALLLISFYHGLDGLDGYRSCGGRYRSKSLLLSPGLRLCSLMRMLSHVSELPCLTLPIRLVCCWQTESHKAK